MLDTFVKYQLNPYFVLAIVFPELIRYSKLQDVIESNDLKVLYVQFGDTYSNFSIGRFQMKPSFCEQLEKDYNKYVTFACQPVHHLLTKKTFIKYTIIRCNPKSPKPQSTYISYGTTCMASKVLNDFCIFKQLLFKFIGESVA